jgi:NO-binding membrane sensor protein with MHYT domain
MLTVHNFSYGLLTPVLGYVMSCMGAFIGLRCTTRAYAYEGSQRARWLILAAIALGTTGIWVMHFIAMLGYTIPGITIHYNVPITIGSMLIAVIVVAIGLFIVGFGQPGWRNLLLAGVVTGIGVASMHYTGMAAMELPARMSYKPALFAVSILIAIVAATAALWAALRLRGLWHTVGAAMIMGVAVSGMHYVGMAAMEMHALPADAQTTYGGPTAAGFLLPLIIGIGVVALVFAGVLAFSPTNEEIREDAELMARISAATARLGGEPYVPAAPSTVAPRWQGPAGSRAGTPAANGNGMPGRAPGSNGSSPAGSATRNGSPGPTSAFYRNGDGAAPEGPAEVNGRPRRGRRAGNPPADPGRRSLAGGWPGARCRPEWERDRRRGAGRGRGCPGLAAAHLPGAIGAHQAPGHGLAAYQEPGRHLPAELRGCPARERRRRACAAQAQERDPGYGRHRCPAVVLRARRGGRG